MKWNCWEWGCDLTRGRICPGSSKEACAISRSSAGASSLGPLPIIRVPSWWACEMHSMGFSGREQISSTKAAHYHWSSRLISIDKEDRFSHFPWELPSDWIPQCVIRQHDCCRRIRWCTYKRTYEYISVCNEPEETGSNWPQQTSSITRINVSPKSAIDDRWIWVSAARQFAISHVFMHYREKVTGCVSVLTVTSGRSAALWFYSFAGLSPNAIVSDFFFFSKRGSMENWILQVD